MTTRLSNQTFSKALTILARRDPDLRQIVKRHGNPPTWQRPTGFKTLTLLILEQQVSLASARAAYDRLSAAMQDLDDALGSAFAGLRNRFNRAHRPSREGSGHVSSGM